MQGNVGIRCLRANHVMDEKLNTLKDKLSATHFKKDLLEAKVTKSRAELVRRKCSFTISKHHYLPITLSKYCGLWICTYGLDAYINPIYNDNHKE